MPITLDGTNGIDTPDLASSGPITGTTAAFSGSVTANGLSTELRPLVAGTAQASTSGTNIDFTGIPSWAKRVTLMFSGVSTSGTQTPFFQLGTSSGLATSGYENRSANIQTSTVGVNTPLTTGIGMLSFTNTAVRYGAMVFLNVTGNLWIASGMITITTAGNFTDFVTGSVTLSGALERLRFSAGTTDTFDAGTVNIMWE